jgi:hypothetical protein
MNKPELSRGVDSRDSVRSHTELPAFCAQENFFLPALPCA